MPDPARRQPVYLGDHRALTRTVHGHAIFVDTRDLQSGPRLLLDGTASPAAAAGVREAVRPGDLVLELGSGFGELTLLAGELVGDGGRVVAIEPDETRAQLLAEGLVANDLDGRARVETGPLAGAVTLDAYAAAAGIQPDVIVLAPGTDAHRALAGAAQVLAAAPPTLRVVVGSTPNGEAALLAAAGLVPLAAAPDATLYGAPGSLGAGAARHTAPALPAGAPASAGATPPAVRPGPSGLRIAEPAVTPVPPAAAASPAEAKTTTVVAFADELLADPLIAGHFVSAYRGQSATLVVVGPGWEQDDLDARLAPVAAAAGLPGNGLELMGICAPFGSGIDEELAKLADVVLTREPLPPAFRFVMRVEPSTGAPPPPAAPAPGGGVPAGWLAADEPDGPPLPLFEERPGFQRSRLCTQEQFDEPEYARWVAEFKQTPRLHRKQWEYVYICRALEERGMLQPGRRGIGFGVGSEPLPALFAKYGADVIASDLDLASATEQGWLNGNQHAAGLEALNKLGICPADEFAKRVSFRVEDMNDISHDLDGQLDFTWSSCCFEHLGGIEQGLRFVEESIRLLKPGGVAVHTTEFNLSSNHQTVTSGGVVIFRRRDIDRLAQRLTRAGHRICLDYSEGDGPADRHVDLPPYAASPHLRLLLMGFVSTSIGLIVQKGEA